MLEDGPPDSYLVKTALKWLNRSGVSAMGIGPKKSMKGVHNWPLENIENAVRFLQSQGYDRVGVISSSFGSNMAISAAARIRAAKRHSLPVRERLLRYLNDILTEGKYPERIPEIDAMIKKEGECKS